METELFSRRKFLWGSGVAFAGVSLLGGCWTSGKPISGVVAGPLDRAGDHFLGILDVETENLQVVELPLRGHGCAVHPTESYIVVASRRPGVELMVIDWGDSRVLFRVVAPEGRHFQGHVAFSIDGRLCFATENCIDTSPIPDITPQESVIGVYDVSSRFQRIGEFATGGVGAHELLANEDGTLWVANGGVYTHPDYARQKLNIDTMEPSLVQLGTDGRLLKRMIPTHHQLSLRHLSHLNGGVFAGFQFEGEQSEPISLCVRGDKNELLEWGSQANYAVFDDYVGSVCTHKNGYVCATSPVGGVVVMWTDEGELVNRFDVVDVCGVAAVGDYFCLTTGEGTVHLVDTESFQIRKTIKTPGWKWDNHLVAIDT